MPDTTVEEEIARTIEQLGMLFDQDLPCGIGYFSCLEAAGWISDGQCPECFAKALGRLICDACKQAIESGSPMRHDACGYRGRGNEFFVEFRTL